MTRFESSLRRRILLGLYLIHTQEGLAIWKIDPSTSISQTCVEPGDILESINGEHIKSKAVLFKILQKIQDKKELYLGINH